MKTAVRLTILSLPFFLTTGLVTRTFAEEPEDLRQKGDAAWASGMNAKIPAVPRAKVIGWFCPKCNFNNKDMRSTRCVGCGHDHSPKSPPKKSAPGISPAFPIKPVGTGVAKPGLPPTSFVIPTRLDSIPPPPVTHAVPGLPENTFGKDKDREVARLAATRNVTPEIPKGIVTLLRDPSAKVTEAEWDRARSLARRIDEIDRQGLRTTAEEIAERDRAARRLREFQETAIFLPDLRIEEMERLMIRLRVAPDATIPVIRSDEPPAKGLIRVIPPPPPTIEPSPPTPWDRMKEAGTDATDAFENAMKRLHERMQKKTGVRTPAAPCAIRG